MAPSLMQSWVVAKQGSWQGLVRGMNPKEQVSEPYILVGSQQILQWRWFWGPNEGDAHGSLYCVKALHVSSV